MKTKTVTLNSGYEISGLRFAYCGSYGLHRAKGKSRADHRGNCK